MRLISIRCKDYHLVVFIVTNMETERSSKYDADLPEMKRKHKTLLVIFSTPDFSPAIKSAKFENFWEGTGPFTGADQSASYSPPDRVGNSSLISNISLDFEIGGFGVPPVSRSGADRPPHRREPPIPPFQNHVICLKWGDKSAPVRGPIRS